jgi:hypothetical protein
MAQSVRTFRQRGARPFISPTIWSTKSRRRIITVVSSGHSLLLTLYGELRTVPLATANAEHPNAGSEFGSEADIHGRVYSHLYLKFAPRNLALHYYWMTQITAGDVHSSAIYNYAISVPPDWQAFYHPAKSVVRSRETGCHSYLERDICQNV